MATAIRSGEMKDILGVPCAWPALESFEDLSRRSREAAADTVRKARRAVSTARNATEDLAAEASLEVRRHPLTAVGLSTAAGIFTGCLFGFAAAWYVGHRG